MEDLIRAHGDGDSIAASTLQPGLRRLETSFGAWAYHRVGGVDVTLGGPLCAAHDRAEMVRRFLSRSRRPVLVYLREPLLAELEGAGLHCASIGVDRHVDLAAELAAPAKCVRGALRKATKAGLRLRPLALDSLDADGRARLRAITARYLAHAQISREMSFLNWPMGYEADGLRRVYALEKFDREHQGMFGYVVLNPVFAGGRRTGWLLDILRFEPTRLWGVWLAVVHQLADQLADQGEELSLGFAPLHRLRPAPCAGSRVLQAQLDWMVRYLSTTQYLTRLRELKDSIPGHEEPRYIASFSRSVPRILLPFLDAMGVAPGSLLGPRLLAVLAEGAADQLQRRRGGGARWLHTRTSRPA